MTVMSAHENDDENLSAWFKFLSDYANDKHPPDVIPHPPPVPHGLSKPNNRLDFDYPLYSSVDITREIAARVREFYAHHGYFPPPRAPLESFREQIIHEYDLYSEQQTKNIQAATSLMQAFFGGICAFTIFRNNIQELVALAGPADAALELGLYTGMRLLPEVTLCGHSVLSLNRSLFIRDLSQDWRYRNNPFAVPHNGIKSYIGSPVSLKLDPSSTSEKRIVSIGVFNQFYVDKTVPKLTSDQEKVLQNVLTMLETQIRATWAGQGRTREARARREVSDLLENILVVPEDAVDQSVSKKRSGMEHDAKEAIKRMKTVMEEMDTAIIIDISGLQVLVSDIRELVDFSDILESAVLP